MESDTVLPAAAASQSPPEQPASKSSARQQLLAFVAFAIIFLAVRFLFVPVGQFNLLNDSHDYLYTAQALFDDPSQPPRKYDHPTGAPHIPRPVGYALVLRLFGVSDQYSSTSFACVTIFQFVACSLAFAYVANTLTKHVLRTRIAKFLAFFSLLALSCTEYVAVWDSLVLTESVTITCHMLLLGALVASHQSSSRWSVLLVALALLVVVALRDTNVFLPICVLLVILICGHAGLPRYPRARWRVMAMIAVACFALTLFTALTAARGRRGDVNLTNVLSLRVLADPANFNSFVERSDLPRSVEPLIGKPAWLGWRDNPEYIAWLRTHGRSSYLGFLASHPTFCTNLIARSLKDLSGEISAGGLTVYAQTEGYRPRDTPQMRRCAELSKHLATGVAMLRNFAGWAGVWIAVSAVACAGLLVSIAGRVRGAVAAIAFGILVVTMQLLLVTFGDAFEGYRHAITGLVMMWVTSLIGLVQVVDAACCRLLAARPQSDPPTPQSDAPGLPN